MKKTTLIIIVSLIVIAVMLFLTFRRGRKAPEMETVTVVRGDLVTSIFASGEIKSAAQADIFAQTSGTISSLPVKDGQTVYQGQALLQLDTTAARAAVAQKEWALKTALQKKKNLGDGIYSEIDLKAAEALVNEKHAAWIRAEEDYNEDKSNEDSRAVRDFAYTAYLQAEENLEDLKNSNPTEEDWIVIEAEIESAKKALADAELDLSRTTIAAPQNGTLLFADSEVGKVSSTAVVNKGQKLFTIADLSSFIFEVEVDESEIKDVEIGQKVRITFDAYPGMDFEGQVSKIAKTTTLDSSGNKVVEVGIELRGISGDEEGLLLGLSGDAEIIFEEKKDILLVPLDAVFSENGKDFVFVVEGEKLIKREVRLGLENEDLVEVVEGLREGEEVVAERLEEVKKGGQSRPRMRFLGH